MYSLSMQTLAYTLIRLTLNKVLNEVMTNCNLICLFQAVKLLECMGMDVKNDVQLTAKTMSVTYKWERVLDVLRDG